MSLFMVSLKKLWVVPSFQNAFAAPWAFVPASTLSGKAKQTSDSLKSKLSSTILDAADSLHKNLHKKL